MSLKDNLRLILTLATRGEKLTEKKIGQQLLQYLVQRLDQFILACFLKFTTFMANNQRSITFLDARWFFFWSNCNSLLLHEKTVNSSAPSQFSTI